MLDDAVRISFLLLSGLTLGLAVVWYLHFCYQEIRGTGQVVIDPVTVVTDEGQGSENLGQALAQMLQARLESLAGEFQSAEEGLTAPSSEGASTVAPERVGNVRGWTPNVPLKIFLLKPLDTGLLKPVEMKLSVGGVDVGGMLPWLQRKLSSRRTLHYTIYTHGDETQVFGSVAALRVSGPGVRLVVKGADGKAPSLNEVIDRLAYEIIRRKLATDSTNKVELLQPDEFMSLAVVVVNAGDSNRRSMMGRPVKDEFVEMLPKVTDLSDKIPQWPELGYFAGWIADKGSEPTIALKYYRRVIPQFNSTKPERYPGLVEYLTDHIAQISAAAAASDVDTVLAAGDAHALPATKETGAAKAFVDYTPDFKFVRDSGAEGSVVGQALATALEFQIKKNLHQDVRISARYIYYAAREVAGTTSSDSGAIIKDAVRVLSKEGAVEESVWRYKAGQFADKPPAAVDKATRYLITNPKSLKKLDDVKRALATNGPVVLGIPMYTEAFSPEVGKTGIIPFPKAGSQTVGGHAIVLVGYDDQKRQFKFVNSWGPGWGDGGFGYISFDYIEKYMTDAWTFKATSKPAKAGEQA